METQGFLSQYKAVAGVQRVWIATPEGDEVLVPVSQLMNSNLAPFGQVWYVDTVNGNNNNDGLSSDAAFLTIQQAVDAASANDAILVNGLSDEVVTIARSKGALTLIGAGNLGQSGIESSDTGSIALRYSNDDLTLINFGVAAESSAAYAMFGTGSRLRMYNCKIEGVDTTGGIALGVGPGSVAQVNADTEGNAGDLLIVNCEFIWSDNGIGLVASDYGVPTQVKIKGCEFSNLTVKHILGVPAGFGIGSVRNLELEGGNHDNLEDGTAPTKFIEVGTAFDTGIITGNSFAIATNAIAKFTIGANIKWVVNKTEAGNSTARPA